MLLEICNLHDVLVALPLKKMQQPIFYFKMPTNAELISLFGYLLLSILLYFHIKSLSSVDQESYFFMYALGTQMILYFFGYRALRNMTYFSCCIVFALIHFYIYWQLKDDQTLIRYGPGVNLFRNTILFLLLFQVLRIISLKIQHQELVSISKSEKDIFQERKVTVIDKVLSVIYIAALFCLTALS